MNNLDLGVITGDKTLKVEAVISNKDLLRVGAVIFVAFFISGMLANIVTR